MKIAETVLMAFHSLCIFVGFFAAIVRGYELVEHGGLENLLFMFVYAVIFVGASISFHSAIHEDRKQ